MIRSLQKVLSSESTCSRFGPQGRGMVGRVQAPRVRRAPWGGVGEEIFRLMVLRDLCIDFNESGCVGMLILR